MHRSAPEVIEEYIIDRSMRSQILVVPDRADIVKHESAVNTVVIYAQAGHDYNKPDPSSLVSVAAAPVLVIMGHLVLVVVVMVVMIVIVMVMMLSLALALALRMMMPVSSVPHDEAGYSIFNELIRVGRFRLSHSHRAQLLCSRPDDGSVW